MQRPTDMQTHCRSLRTDGHSCAGGPTQLQDGALLPSSLLLQAPRSFLDRRATYMLPSRTDSSCSQQSNRWERRGILPLAVAQSSLVVKDNQGGVDTWQYRILRTQ